MKYLGIRGLAAEVGTDLEISENEFENTPNLNELDLQNINLKDTTLTAIENLKERLQDLSLNRCTPSQKCIKLPEKFTNLHRVSEIGNTPNNNVLSQTTFQNSAGTLDFILIKGNLPIITPAMFKGMRNLLKLFVSDCKITIIQPGSFDDLINLEELSLENNPIKLLPDGLFKNTKKLKQVFLKDTEIENLSRDNFTNVENFFSFKFGNS